jgi:multicomponent Na+:H+ antiporter subunit E
MNYISMFIATFILWKIVTWNFEVADTLVGILVSLFVTILFGKEIPYHPKKAFQVRRYLSFIKFFIIFIKQMVKANFIMAYRVLSPGPPIRPGFIKIPIHLKSPLGRIILANSITLAPGTFTMDIDKDSLNIHWIYKYTDDPIEAEKMICGKMQDILKEVFE